MQKIEGRRKPIIFRQDQLDRLAKVMKRHNITESEAIRTMIDIGLDSYETCAMFGIPQLAELRKQVRKTLKEKRAPRLV